MLLTPIDWVIIGFVLAGTVGIGFYNAGKSRKTDDDYIVSSREMGLFAFVAVNVSTWYGGILGIGEYSYRYGISSWFTQGFPYYLFAFLFAFVFAGRVRATGLLSIPAKIKAEYGSRIAIIASVLVFIITSPAPYLLTAAQIVATIFGTSVDLMMILIPIPLIIYLSIGGFRSNINVDVFLFFFMFAGFFAAVIYLSGEHGGVEYLKNNLPPEHLSLTGGSSFFYLLVWYLVAAWTIADPGFHQRVYSAKSAGVARNGILISILLWSVFDFFTNTSGLYSRALEPGLADPVSAFPVLALQHLPAGIRGLFLASLFATVYTTLNSFIFLSGVTFSNDIVREVVPKNKFNLKIYSFIGMFISTTIAVALGIGFRSIVDIWYYIGSLFVPSLIFLITGAYFPKARLGNTATIVQVVSVPVSGILWLAIRNGLDPSSYLYEIEPMIAGLVTGSLFYLQLLAKKQK